jgi:colanic acid/amylovoran biosynthesis glycosyltransferase
MLHISRHVLGLSSFSPVVIAQKNEGEWPGPSPCVIPRSSFRFVGRFREKYTGQPWQISEAETDQILAVLKKTNAQLLHVFFGNVAIHLLPLIRRSPVPVVTSFHGSDITGAIASPGYAKARQELFARCAVIPCRSEQLTRGVELLLGCPVDKIRLMRTILPDIPFVQRHPPADGVWRLVQAARLVAKKGIATSLRAFAQFLQSCPNSTFTVAGEGPLENELRAEAMRLNIDQQVEFVGFLPQEELQGLFSVSHIFIHPSETVGGDVEGVPNAMLEAMAGGLPVVATRHGGIPEVICDGENGFLCAEGDDQQLATTLLNLASDPTLYRRMSETASSSVREQFSAGKQIAAIETIYRQAILA